MSLLKSRKYRGISLRGRSILRKNWKNNDGGNTTDGENANDGGNTTDATIASDATDNDNHNNRYNDNRYNDNDNRYNGIRGRNRNVNVGRNANVDRNIGRNVEVEHKGDKWSKCKCMGFPCCECLCQCKFENHPCIIL